MTKKHSLEYTDFLFAGFYEDPLWAKTSFFCASAYCRKVAGMSLTLLFKSCRLMYHISHYKLDCFCAYAIHLRKRGAAQPTAKNPRAPETTSTGQILTTEWAQF